MLQRLELIGFKSFAEKTQFDFSDGVTAIVGPNGSGKSNIVDAVRWILGEQSAKSLRGGEMADVIFNGSSSRRSFGLAEVTMTFDNSRKTLATDSPTVQITRRVYRDGEGEYLINQHPCRLKDIKDLFLGSGAGSDAYCIIEQGRVDVLLQSSTRERRTIFEEAAGISRFKAKKTETLRKLERVDLNLQRLRDIIAEVEKQLRSLRLQASKAQRYQEYSQRLQELRVALGLEEYHQLSERLQAEMAALEGLRSGLNEKAAQAEAWEAEIRRLEAALAELDAALHEQEGLLATARQQIASAESTLSHEWTLSADLETDLTRTRTRLAELNGLVAALAEAVHQAAGELQGVEAQTQEQRQGVSKLDEELQATVQRLNDLRAQVQSDHAEHFEQMRLAGRLQNDVVSYKAQVDNLRRERDRLRQKTAQAAENLASIDLELQELSAADDALQARMTEARRKLAEQRQEHERVSQARDATTQRVAALREQRSGLASRIEVLEGLERSHEGLGTGVREVFALLEQPDPGPWRTVLGLTVDFLTVRREYAPLIDLALGEKAQRFVVRDPALLAEALRQRGQPFSGRVGFLPLSAEPACPLPDGTVQVTGLEGVVARAADLVTCEHPDLADLPRQLLGQTLIVRDLAAARSLWEKACADGTRGAAFGFVTLQGEVLEADGTLTVGTHHAETGVLSRKSELRELRQQVTALDKSCAEAERELAALKDRLADLDAQLAFTQQEINVLGEQAADLRTRIGQHRQRRGDLHEEVTLGSSEMTGIERDIESLEESWRRAGQQTEAAERQVQALQARLASADHELREREQQRQLRQQEVTMAKVALATVEERCTALRTKLRQSEGDLDRRRQEHAQGEQHLATARARLNESQRTLLGASASLAHWYLEKEAAERRAADLTRERDLQRQERQLLADRTQAVRGEWQTLKEQAHAHELEANDLRHRRDTAAERLHEDYQIDLAEMYEQAVRSGQWAVGSQEASASADTPSIAPPQSAEPIQPTAQEEIAELKRKLSRLGSVNLDSLQELAEQEQRAAVLQAQLADLTSAQHALQEIIAKINQDSRRLFQETFTAIRTHFQELFRKLFGGGTADIVLEDEIDILESGIEIIARPPGKELRSISLMSGGEKTLTVVALLLAIFRSKPSPFCILDEVDAALDEANIGRFTAVLRDFLDRSQFIIITHSKRTMAAADVLYGITMQESGVSKRVAVRFEDWPEDGVPPNEAQANGAQAQTEPGFAGR